VYGSLGKTGFFKETTPLNPRSPYSASKTSADLFVKAYADTYKMPVSITRCSNNYGPYHFPEKLIPLVINNILEGKKLPVYGDGANVRDWLYVEDHCKAIDAVIHRGKAGEIYNVGGNNEWKNIDIVRTIISTIRQLMTDNPAYKKALKKRITGNDGELSVEWINDDLITFVKDRLGHDRRYAIDPTKIMNELGWKPETDFNTGILKKDRLGHDRRYAIDPTKIMNELGWKPETDFNTGILKTVRWYLEHQDWVAEILKGDYINYYNRMYAGRFFVKPITD